MINVWKLLKILLYILSKHPEHLLNLNNTKKWHFYDFWENDYLIWPPWHSSRQFKISKISQNVCKSLSIQRTANEMGWNIFYTPFDTKICKKPLYFHDFPIQMYGPIGQKHVTLCPGIFPKVFGLEIAYLAYPYHPESLKKISKNIKCLFCCSYHWLCIWLQWFDHWISNEKKNSLTTTKPSWLIFNKQE